MRSTQILRRGLARPRNLNSYCERHPKHALSIILAFIGVKLILHAMHENELPFINGGQHIGWAPVIPTFASLGFIVATIVVAVIASLFSPAGKRAKIDAELAADAERARTGGPEH